MLSLSKNGQKLPIVWHFAFVLPRLWHSSLGDRVGLGKAHFKYSETHNESVVTIEYAACDIHLIYSFIEVEWDRHGGKQLPIHESTPPFM